MAKVKYTVKSPLVHGDKGAEPRRYEIGDTVDLDDADAAKLSSQVIDPAAADKPAKKS